MNKPYSFIGEYCIADAKYTKEGARGAWRGLRIALHNPCQAPLFVSSVYPTSLPHQLRNSQLRTFYWHDSQSASSATCNLISGLRVCSATCATFAASICSFWIGDGVASGETIGVSVCETAGVTPPSAPASFFLRSCVKEYVQYIADRRFDRLGLPLQYNTESPFPWMAEVIDMPKEKNFFETKVTEYKTGGSLEW